VAKVQAMFLILVNILRGHGQKWSCSLDTFKNRLVHGGTIELYRAYPLDFL
jgi:hypothetical protein